MSDRPKSALVTSGFLPPTVQPKPDPDGSNLDATIDPKIGDRTHC
jgi:hypothetical protein